MTRLRIKKIVTLAFFSATAIVLGIAENALPIVSAVPGGKIGIANAVSLIVLYTFDVKSAFAVSIIRALVTSLSTGASSLPYSLSGAVLSMSIMAVFYKNKNISPVGVCILGAFFNNAAQIFTSCIMLGSLVPVNYFLILAPISVIGGFSVGTVVVFVLKYNKVFMKEDKL